MPHCCIERCCRQAQGDTTVLLAQVQVKLKAGKRIQKYYEPFRASGTSTTEWFLCPVQAPRPPPPVFQYGGEMGAKRPPRRRKRPRPRPGCICRSAFLFPSLLPDAAKTWSLIFHILLTNQPAPALEETGAQINNDYNRICFDNICDIDCKIGNYCLPLIESQSYNR